MQRTTAFARSILGDTAFACLIVVSLLVLPSRPAEALPSFARQTGQPCTSCHAGFPELTPYGRRFKLRGYSDSVWDSNFPEQPPLAIMVQPTFTHTSKPVDGPDVNPRFKTNDTVVEQQTSLFYAGKIAYTAGAFMQTTYDNTTDRYALDNTDIRVAGTASPFDVVDVTYGLTVNNNPTVEDIYNTTPAWSFPFATSFLAPAPSSSTLIEGGLANRAIGTGVYALWNDLVYTQVGVYSPLSDRFQTKIGFSPQGQDKFDERIPYWRVALQPSWDKHAFEVGTFGLTAKFFPGADQSNGHDRISDVGFDFQYQFLGDPNYASVQGSWIHEHQNRDATFALGNSSNTSDTLQTFKIKTSYIYDETYEATIGYFNIRGTNDATLYGTDAGTPNSAGWNLQLDYLMVKESPLGKIWPWAGGRISLLYTAYTKFNGSGHDYNTTDHVDRNASNNNTLALIAWLAF